DLRRLAHWPRAFSHARTSAITNLAMHRGYETEELPFVAVGALPDVLADATQDVRHACVVRTSFVHRDLAVEVLEDEATLVVDGMKLGVVEGLGERDIKLFDRNRIRLPCLRALEDD